MVKGRRSANDRGVNAKEIFLGAPLAFTSFPPHKDMLLQRNAYKKAW
jgi:hypothetical protein